jgi:hypothetical protein
MRIGLIDTTNPGQNENFFLKERFDRPFEKL